ncbi:MAG: copper chaperone PCu(A)C [Pseudomonadota bacterium]
MKYFAFRRNSALAAAMVAGLLAVPAMADVVGGEGWSRATPPGAREAVGYLVLTNKGDEERRLLKITSTISDSVSIHRSSVNAQGVAQMWPVGFLKLEAGETVRFEPNGLHVMFSGLKKPLQAGDKLPLVLQFDGREKPFTVMLEVRPLVPATAAPEHSQHDHH